MPIRVFVVDSQAVVRAGLNLAFADPCEIELVGEASSLPAGFDAILAARPDVLIVDFQPNDIEQVRLLRELNTGVPQIRVLAFTAEDCPQIAVLLAEFGVAGYLVKDASLEELKAGVGAVHAGRVFISHSNSVATKPHLANRASDEISDRAGDLSERETEVLLLFGEGLTNKDVAQRLFISVKTVETYRSRIIKKHQLNGRAELFEFARRIGRLRRASVSTGANAS